jgi:hypothetical protein
MELEVLVLVCVIIGTAVAIAIIVLTRTSVPERIDRPRISTRIPEEAPSVPEGESGSTSQVTPEDPEGQEQTPPAIPPWAPAAAEPENHGHSDHPSR